MALCDAALARARGEESASDWLAIRPALVARPAPFLEAYVLWRAAEAMAGSGSTTAAAEPLREGYAVAARSRLSSFDARVLDLQAVLEAGTPAALARAGRTLAGML